MKTLLQFGTPVPPRPRRFWERGPASPAILVTGLILHITAYVASHLLPLPHGVSAANLLLFFLELAGMGLFLSSGLALAASPAPARSRRS